MENFRRNFFQILLIILALAFTVCIRYLTSTRSTEAGTFTQTDNSAVTISDLFKEAAPERQEK